MDVDNIQRLILNKLSYLTKEYQVDMIYACESGSRAWGFPSPDSDYDVRYIYLLPMDDYLRLHENSDVINLPIEHTPQGILDLGGWDLRKTLRLAVKSNPVIWEWLQSPICYHSHPRFDLGLFRDVIDPFYSPISACHHYLSICRNTLEKELTGSQVKIKKYFYMLRPLLAGNWIERTRSIPPMEFESLLCLLDDLPTIKELVRDLLSFKQQTDEHIPIDRVTALDHYILTELGRLQNAAQTLPAGSGDIEALNRLFLSFLGR